MCSTEDFFNTQKVTDALFSSQKMLLAGSLWAICLMQTFNIIKLLGTASSVPISVSFCFILSTQHLWLEANSYHVTDQGLSEDAHTQSMIDTDTNWSHTIHHAIVVGVQSGCGRMQNRLLTFSDGQQACARYRQNVNQMQGEVYAYYLARLLGMQNVLPEVAVLPDQHSEQWQSVQDEIQRAGWKNEKPVLLTPYISTLYDSYLPWSLRSLTENSLNRKRMANHSEDQLEQWSDLIIFDYIIANTDRLVNSLHNRKWNRDIMDLPVHNLGERGSNHELVFYDNEDGLWHGYRVLDSYSHYHEQLLKMVCIYRRQTESALIRLIELGEKGLMDKFTAMAERFNPVILQYIPKLHSGVAKTIIERTSAVVNQLKHCAVLNSLTN